MDEILQVHVSKNLASLLVLLLFKMLEWKVAKLFPVVAKKVAKASFYINRDLVKNSPNIRKMCGLLLWDNFMPKMFINRTIWSHCFIWWLWKEVKAEENTKNHCLADGYYKLKMRYRVWIWELINFFAKIFRLKQSTVWIMDLQSRWRPPR